MDLLLGMDYHNVLEWEMQQCEKDAEQRSAIDEFLRQRGVAKITHPTKRLAAAEKMGLVGLTVVRARLHSACQILVNAISQRRELVGNSGKNIRVPRAEVF